LKLTKLVAAASVAALPLALSPDTAAADTLERLLESKTLTIAFDPSVPPWSYKDQDLNYTGYEYMIAKKLADDHGLELEIVETNGANRIPLLITGKVDLVISAMTITRQDAEGAVEVSVADTGPGIAPEVAAELFNPFVTTKKGGMGIGLSVSKSIVEAHGGRIWVALRPGRGSRFAFTLPAGQAAQAGR